MTDTTLIKKHPDMRHEPLENCHDGEGALDWKEVLAPGVSIGIHSHKDDEEYYYILAGAGTMSLDGEDFRVAAGDITAVYPGGDHGLLNDGDQDLRVLVFSIS
ncbi:MAG: cupin domain-containing protein [Candidatus Latescibacterota bacterium]|jgi:quercetin dioxygenase-like cupin family protein